MFFPRVPLFPNHHFKIILPKQLLWINIPSSKITVFSHFHHAFPIGFHQGFLPSPPARGSSSDFDFTSLSTWLLRHHAGAAKAAPKAARAKARARRGEAMGSCQVLGGSTEKTGIHWGNFQDLVVPNGPRWSRISWMYFCLEIGELWFNMLQSSKRPCDLVECWPPW